MHISCRSTLVFLPIFCALFAHTAFLPATVPLDNETLIRLPIVNVSKTFIATEDAPIPVSFRQIILAFLVKGRPIPEHEVRATLIDADQAIAGLAREYPNQRIANDRFEYRRPDGNMLISIRTILGEEITWMELVRVLQGLYRYMTAGIDTPETHYQALEFEIEASTQEKPNIGYGLVWYFGQTESKVQKRVTLPSPISLISEGTLLFPNLTIPQPSIETLRLLPNATLSSPGAHNVQETEIFPIPKTSLSLNFYFFGPSIPAQSVKATLQGATAKVRPFLNGPSEMDPIENDAFRWVLPLSREAGIPVAVTVYTYHGHVITWRQLFDVFFGLYAFATTFGTDLHESHYQVLGFRIVDIDSRKLGVGTISYFRPGISQLATGEEVMSNGTLLHRPSLPNISSLNAVAVSDSIRYPVANTDIVLTFTFLGDTPISSVEINDAISDAQNKLTGWVKIYPDAPIPGVFQDMSTSGRVSTNVFVYSERFITWKELDDILRGILLFCQDDQAHERVLVYEIDINAAGRGRVGFGTLLYVQPDPTDVQKRAAVVKNMTLLLPTSSLIPPLSLTVPFPWPVPGSPITLMFSAFGSRIPSIYVKAAITSALSRIQVHVIHHPDTPIPNNRWERGDVVSNVWIAIIAYNGNTISWQELSSVMVALLHFMTAVGEHRCRDLGFFFDRLGEIAAGYGTVAYFPPGDVRGQ